MLKLLWILIVNLVFWELNTNGAKIKNKDVHCKQLIDATKKKYIINTKNINIGSYKSFNNFELYYIHSK